MWLVLTVMAKPAVQLGRAGVRCCRNVPGNGVFSPAVSQGRIMYAVLSKARYGCLMSSPNALSCYMSFCVFPAVLLQALGPETSNQDASSVAASLRDTLAAEPA